MTTLPFTFAWVNETDNTFDPATMDRTDEDIISFDIKHSEGQHPTLDIVVKNPRIGLLGPTRKVWAWIAWRNDTGTLVPIFFGVLIGVPTSLFKEIISLQFIARSPTYVADKQAVAESMKIAPYFDPLWFDASHRDDPDSILEGWSSLWHTDRTSLMTSASDILVGEDGIVTFDPNRVSYNSVDMRLGQPPLSNVRIEASVNWTQRTSGFFPVPTVNVQSYTGSTFVSDWPKTGAGIGGGYKVQTSYVEDIFHIAQTPTTTYNSTWNNPQSNDPDLIQCSPLTQTSASSGPALRTTDFLTAVLTEYTQTGLCDPYSDPPENHPSEVKVTGFVVPLWSIRADMTLRYDANRAYSELVTFDMTANTQSVLTSPLVSQFSELITLSSVDLGQPLETVYAWTDYEGQSVSVATIIFPNNPTHPGGLSYQICVTAGIAGNAEPVFSDRSGVTTSDGSVVWASLGQQGITGAANWSPASGVPVGEIVLLQNQTFNAGDGQFEDIPGATTYYICVQSGTTNDHYRTFKYTPTLQTNDEAPPAQIEISVIDPPRFSQAVGDRVHDGSVQWLVLGKNPAALSIPIGGTPDDVKARQFFPTARGLQSVEFLICKARARLRLRSRAVQVSWAAPFADGVALSCRKSATIFDPRLPGGAATGKITEYKLSCHKGRLQTQVTIGCTIGYGDSVTQITGTPVYASAGYMSAGYQQYDGAMYVHGANDTTYSRPGAVPFDDGLHFPLSWGQVGSSKLTGDGQEAAIKASFAATRELAYQQFIAGKSFYSGVSGIPMSSSSGITPNRAWQLEEETLAYTQQLTPAIMAAHPVVWTAVLKPCAGNGPFDGAYAIQVSPLVLPKGIDLSAPSQ